MDILKDSYVQPKAILYIKDFFSLHVNSYVQPKTILLQYKSIFFDWTYELICEEKKSSAGHMRLICPTKGYTLYYKSIVFAWTYEVICEEKSL